MTGYDVRKLCIDRNWFTCGGNDAYDKVLSMADFDGPIHDIAVGIWVNSDNAQLEEIEEALIEIARGDRRALRRAMQSDEQYAAHYGDEESPEAMAGYVFEDLMDMRRREQ